MNKIRKSARDCECQVRIPAACNFMPDTTIFAHVGGAGMGAKSNDMHGAYCCSSCHDVIDGRVKSEFSKDEVALMFLQGVMRTQIILIAKGLINVND